MEGFTTGGRALLEAHYKTLGKIAELEARRALVAGTGGGSIAGGARGGGIPDPTPVQAAKILEIDRAAERLEAGRKRLAEAAEKAVSECGATPAEELAARMHYLDGAAWREVALAIYRSDDRRSIQRVYSTVGRLFSKMEEAEKKLAKVSKS